MRKYQCLDIIAFGRHLFSTGDLDPVYPALQKSGYDRAQLARWLVAYWTFYSAGFACYASAFEGSAFWRVLEVAARNDTLAPIGARWPRGAERRHFRAQAATEAVEALKARYGGKPEDMLEMLSTGSLAVGAVINRATVHAGFGPWIGFKIADMIDAVWLPGQLVQDDLNLFLYDTPRQSIEECYAGGILRNLPHPNTADRFEYAMSWLGMQLKNCCIPHKPNSSPDWFSLETVWCKFHSHRWGSYPLYKDTTEIHHGVRVWLPYASSVRWFKKGLPILPKDGLF